MTAEILIPVALAALLLVFALSLLLRRRPKRSARLVSASLEPAPSAPVDSDPIEPSAATASEGASQIAPPTPAPAKSADAVDTGSSKAAQPAAGEKGDFLPTLTPPPVVAASARASVPAQSPAPRFVLQSPLKSEPPSRKTKPVAVSPIAKPKPPSPDMLTPASDKVVDITTAISVRAPQKPKTLRSSLPEEIRAALTKLNQRIDRLEDAVLDLENQLEDFDLDFSQPGKPAMAVANSAPEQQAETATDSQTGEVKSDRDDKTIAA